MAASGGLEKGSGETNGEVKLWVRLAWWFGLYLAAIFFYSDGQSVKPVWSHLPDTFFWYNFAYYFPQQLQLFIIASLSVPYYGVVSRTVLVLVYFSFLLDLVLVLRCSGKRPFWILIALLVALIFLTFWAGDYYVADGVVYQHWSDKGALTPIQ